MVHIPRVQTRPLASTISDTVTATSASSTGITNEGWDIIGLTLPAITSASLGVAVSANGSTYYTLYGPDGSVVSLQAAGTANRAISGASNFESLCGWPYLKLLFGAAQAASAAITWVVQG